MEKMIAEEARIKPFNVFEYGDEYFLINAEDLSSKKINGETAKRLMLVKDGLNPHLLEENHALLNEYRLVDTSFSETNTVNKSGKPPAITHLTLFVSQKCNLRCTYCYGDNGEYGKKGLMDYEVAFNAVDWLMSQSKEKRNLGISFFGGEPLINFSLIKRVVNYAKDQGGKYDKDIEFGITTNGTLLNEEVISFLKQNNIVPIVSFDGPKELQDKQRLFKNGSGTYDFLLKKIKRLLEVLPESICRATIMDSTHHTYVERTLQEIGFKRIQLTVASPSLFDSGEIVKRNLADMQECLSEESEGILMAIKQRDKIHLKKIRYSGLGWHLCRMIEQFIHKQKRYFACGAGRSGVAISVDGEVHLCHRFVGTDGFSLGSIFQNKIDRNLYQISPVRQNKECIQCFAKYFCAGGCYHDNLGMTGSIFSPATDMCGFMHNLACHAGMISAKLESEDIDFLIDKGIIGKKTCLLDLF